MSPFTASSSIGMNVRLFNRITSVVLIVAGEKRFPISDNDKKTNVGLNLKHLKQVCNIHICNIQYMFINKFTLFFLIEKLE